MIVIEVIICIVVLPHCQKHRMVIGVVNYVVLVMDKRVPKSRFLSFVCYFSSLICRSIFFVSMLITKIVFAIGKCPAQHSFQMFTVRLLGRRSTLRVLTGLASGGCALTVAWKHTCLQAAKPPVLPVPKRVQEEIAKKSVVVGTDKFDWNLFWFYLKPQVWIIACATAVGRSIDFSSIRLRFASI